MEATTEDIIAPVIVQDANTKEVLMLGYMNKHAYYQTLQTNELALYNRSTEQTETFGSSCGHKLEAKEFYTNSKTDSILIKVITAGNICENCKECYFKNENLGYAGFVKS